MHTRQKSSASKGPTEPKTGEIVIYKDRYKKASLEVHLEQETVWLSQAQMADLFGKDIRTVSEHIQNIYKEGELKRNPTIRKFRIVQTEGKRHVEREIDFYNLDVIISVGYRVKSQRGTQFRIWATSVLRDHIIKGVTVNQKRIQELKGKQLNEFGEALALLESAKQKALTKDETAGLLAVITDYANAWLLHESVASVLRHRKNIRSRTLLTQGCGANVRAEAIQSRRLKHTALTKFESNVVVKPSVQTVAKIAKALGVPMEIC